MLTIPEEIVKQKIDNEKIGIIKRGFIEVGD
jgi:hypothetical protein